MAPGFILHSGVMQRAYYNATFETFLVADENEILGELARHHGHALEERQRNAWLDQIRNLRNTLTNFGCGHIFFEFSIPRMGRRADVVLLLRGVVIVIEYKVGAAAYNAADIEQAEDYALDLKNFHSGSHKRPIAPVLVSTNAPGRSFDLVWNDDQVAKPMLANSDSLRTTIEKLVAVAREPIVTTEWLRAKYKPTPTIVDGCESFVQQSFGRGNFAV